MDKFTFIKVQNPFNTTKDRDVESRDISTPISISELMSEIETYNPYICLLNSEPLLRGTWEEIRVRDGDIVTVIFLPLGAGQDRSDGKRIGEFVGGLALMAFAGPLASGILSPFGSAAVLPGYGALNGTLGVLIQGFEYAGAGLMLGAFFGPPKTPSAQQDISGSRNYIRASGNTARLGEAIPVVYGEQRVYPDFASLPYSYFEDNYQFVNQDMIVSQGHCDIEQIKIGDTNIASFPEIETKIIHPDVDAKKVKYVLNANIRENVLPLNLEDVEYLQGSLTDPIQVGTNVNPTDSIFLLTNISGVPISTTPQEIYFRIEYRDISNLDALGDWMRADGLNDGDAGVNIWTHYAHKALVGLLGTISYSYESVTTELTVPSTPTAYEVRIALIRSSTSTEPTLALLSKVDKTSEFVGGEFLFPTDYVRNSEVDNIVVPEVTVDGPDGADTDPDLHFVGPFEIGDSSYALNQIWIDTIWGPKPDGRDHGFLRIETRLEGATNWNRIVAPESSSNYNYSIAVPLLEGEVSRNSSQIPLPSGAQLFGEGARKIQIRIAQIKISGEDNISCNLVGIRGRVEGRNTVTDKYTRLQVKMRVTEGISQANSRRVNCIAKRNLKTFQTSSTLTTTESFTNDIVPIFIDAVTNNQYGGKLPVSRLDLQDLHAIHTILTNRGDTFNGVFDTKQSIWETIGLIGKCGRCSPIFQGGELFLVRDQLQTTPIMMFNRNNIVKDSLNLSYSLASEQTPRGIRMEFNNKELGYEKDTIYLNDLGEEVNEEGERYSQLTLFGCTNKEQALRESKYYTQANKFRRTTVNLTTEMQGHIPTFGDLVTVSHDMPNWGLGGEVVGSSGNELLLSEPVEFEDGETYVINLLDSKQNVVGPFTVLEGNEGVRLQSTTDNPNVTISGNTHNNTFVIEEQTLEADGITQTTTNTWVIDYSPGKDRPTFGFGKTDNWTQECRVVSVKPSGQFQVQLTMLIENELVHFEN